jgi:hypothetical protein
METACLLLLPPGFAAAPHCFNHASVVSATVDNLLATTLLFYITIVEIISSIIATCNLAS